MLSAARSIRNALPKSETPLTNLQMTFPNRMTGRRRRCARLPMRKHHQQWRGQHPVLCVAGRSLIDEAAAIMLGQLSTAHGLAARVEPAETLSTANLFRLD